LSNFTEFYEIRRDR
jgi:hypothetical protein